MTEQKPQCVFCGQTNDDLPLVALNYRGQQFWICPQDFPTLIHQPHMLIGKLPGAERLKPHDH